MIEPEAASTRYYVQEERTSLVRRAWTVTMTVLIAAVTLGDPPTPSLRRCQIIKRGTGEVVATIDETPGDNFDLAALVRSDLDQMSVDEFQRVWISGAQTD